MLSRREALPYISTSPLRGFQKYKPLINYTFYWKATNPTEKIINSQSKDIR